MKDVLKNESGSILVMAAAVVLALVSAVSSWALVGMVQNSEYQTQFDHDIIQEELLLRSESIRTHLAMEHNATQYPPDRTVEDDYREVVYNIKSKTEQKLVTIYLGQATELALAVRSLISASRPERPFWDGNRYMEKTVESPAFRLSERLIRNKSLAQYQYFTDIEKSENSHGGPDIVKFWGEDELWGPVHSNDDIWIQNAGGGWPVFHSKVTTHGRCRVWDSGALAVNNAPVEDIFLGGLEEEIDGVPEIDFNPDATLLRQNGVRIGEGNDIVYIHMTGGGCETKVGTIVNTGSKQFDVYSWYPDTPNLANAIVDAGGNWFEDADKIWTNEVAVLDTVWTPGPSLAFGNNATYFSEAKLWIEGVVNGKVTFGSADTIVIVGDIYYTNTAIGDAPDGFSGIDPFTGNALYEGPVNETDYFGLVSEQKILIGYKFKDPLNNFEVDDENCTNVNLYGAYAAIAQGDISLHGSNACHYDGIFTFQYQHGHGSTPSFTAQSPYTLEDTVYTYVDLHKFIFPKSGYAPPSIEGFNLHGNDPVNGQPCGFPIEDGGYLGSYPNNNPTNYAIPYGTDYPWYNPIWPETSATIIWERGILNVWGAIAQTRRGFIHRSGSDDINHPPTGQAGHNQWELEEWHFDGDHPSCGYDKNYRYDNRFLYVQPPNYPQVYEGWGETSITTFDKQSWVFKSPTEW